MEDIALINNLNDDCLKHIFSFLEVEERLEIEKVCKRWRNIGEEGWNDVKELIINDDDSDNLIYLMLKRCGRYLKKLAIGYSSKHPHSLSMAIEFCELDQLEEIELSNLYFDQRNYRQNMRNIEEIFEKSEKLVAVTLRGTLIEMLDYLNFLNPITLRKLELSNRYEYLSFNPDQFPNLKELYLEGFDIIEDEMARDGESLKGLGSLNLGRTYDPQHFIHRILTFTNLRELGLFSPTLDLRNEDIRLIITHCPNIVEMRLRDMHHLKSDCFQYLGEMRSLKVVHFIMFEMDTRHLAYLKNVKKLVFYRCWNINGDKGLIEFIANSSNLKILEFHKCQPIGRPFLNDVEELFQLGQRTKSLKIIIKGRNYKSLNGLMEITYHPLLNLRVQNDLYESEDSFGDDDSDYYGDNDVDSVIS